MLKAGLEITAGQRTMSGRLLFKGKFNLKLVVLN